MHKKKIIVSSFYSFVYLNEPEKIKKYLINKFKKIDIKGTFIIGHEGINGSFSISDDKIEFVKKIIQGTIPNKINFKSQKNIGHSFLRLKIKLKKEIVTIGINDIDPKKITAKHLDSNQWEKLLRNKNSIIIDTRNFYESEIGTFKSSIKTDTKNFRDFPKWIKKNERLLKDKKIGIFCTGGIRCEKAGNLLIKNGHSNVYQLEGGIIQYLNKTKNKKKMWEGECFVFDERIALDENLEKGKYTQCFACRSALTEIDKKSKFFKAGVSCPKCFKTKSQKQRQRYEERQKQIKIAKNKGIKHLGS